MVEWLAMPATGSDPVSLDVWVEAFSALGLAPKVVHDGQGVAWIEVASARLRGYAMIEGGGVEAINFELSEADPSATVALLQRIIDKLSWELHQEDDDDDDS